MIVLADLKIEGDDYRYHLARFIKNEAGLTPAFVESRLSYWRGNRRDAHSRGKQAFFLFARMARPDGSGAMNEEMAVGGVFNVHEERVDLYPTYDVCVEVDYITKNG